MYCKKCNSLLNKDNICPVCESNTTAKENNELLRAIEELKAGNQEAFNVFYNYTSRYVYSRAKTFSSDEQTANDVMQEVYISAFKNINSLKSNDSIFAWLRTITLNASSRMMKKNKNEIILSEENEEMLEVLPDENEQIEEDYMNKQDIEIIHACINRLSEEHRIVILAYYYDNLKVEEIAELLQISIGTVKSRLFIARKKLKEFIEEEENKNGYKLHSFSGFSLVLALRKLLQGNMDISVIDNDALYQAICKKLNSLVITSSANNIIKPKTNFLNTFSGNLKNRMVHKIAEVGIKKILLSTVAAVIATSVIGATVAVVTSNLSNKPTENDLSIDTSVADHTSEEIVSSEEISSDEASSGTSSDVSSSQTSTPSNTESTATPTTSTNQTESKNETTSTPTTAPATPKNYLEKIGLKVITLNDDYCLNAETHECVKVSCDIKETAVNEYVWTEISENERDNYTCVNAVFNGYCGTRSVIAFDKYTGNVLQVSNTQNAKHFSVNGKEIRAWQTWGGGGDWYITCDTLIPKDYDGLMFLITTENIEYSNLSNKALLLDEVCDLKNSKYYVFSGKN